MNNDEIVKNYEDNVCIITVGELLDQLENIDRDAKLNTGPLSFYRIKKRGDDLYCFEFNEPCVKFGKVKTDKNGGKWRELTFQQLLKCPI